MNRMERIFAICSCVSLIAGCTAGAVMPLVVLPASNYLTRVQYAEDYKQYDQEYRDSVSFTEHRISRDQYTIYAREFGAQPGEAKPVIILMHGFPDSLHIYDRLAPLLANRYRVIIFDFLGWGESDKPRRNNYDSESLYRDLEAVVDFAKAGRVSFVVHDASGPPGIDWALSNPGRMDTLVILNTYYLPMDVLVKPEAIETFSTPGVRRAIIRAGARVSNYGWKRGYQSQLRRFFYDDQQRELMLPVLTHQSMDIRRAFFQLNDVLDEEVLSRAENENLLRAYQGPVTIIFGNSDPYLNLEVGEKFQEMFPNSSLHSVDRAAHFVQLDRPEEVARIILNGKTRQLPGRSFENTGN